MKAYQWSLLSVFLLLIVASVSGALPWDTNTVSLLHFDNITTIYDDVLYESVSLDQSPGYFWGDIDAAIPVFSRCKFGQCTFLTDDYSGFADIMSMQDLGTGFSFGKEGNWTVEGWVNLTVAPAANMNGTLVSWMGYGDATEKTLNGTHIYINSARMIGVTTPSTITGAPLIISTTALPLNTWNSFAVVKNGSSLKLFVNGKQNATTSTANTYNWSQPTGAIKSVGHSGYTSEYFGSSSPIAYIDEFRISDTPRYGGNYTPQTVEFFNPLNKTTAFSEAGTTTYNVGESVTINNYISNTSYLMGFVTAYQCFSSTCSLTSQSATLPSGWSLSGNDIESIGYSVEPSSSISSKTKIGESVVSMDTTGSYTIGTTILDPYDGEDYYLPDYPSSAFSIQSGGSDWVSGQDYLAYSYPAKGTVIDLSNRSSVVVFESEDYDSINIGQKINVTVVSQQVSNTSGIKGSLYFNKTVWSANNVYNAYWEPAFGSIYSSPYYDISYTIDNNLGFVNFTALYPEYGGVKTDYGDYEAYVNVEFSPNLAALTKKTNSEIIYMQDINYTAGNPFINSNGYTYTAPMDIMNFYKPLGFTDNYMLTHVRLIDINTNTPIDGAAAVSYDARLVSPASPINVVGGLFDITHKGGSFNITATADGYFASTQTFVVGEDGTTIDVILTPFSGPSSQMQFYPKYTTFHVKEGWGLALSDVDVTMTPISTSMGDWDWVGTLLGIPIGEIPLDTAALHQTTDSFGTATFYVVPTEKYNVTFTKTGYTILPMIVVPKEDDYYVWANNIDSTYYTHGYNELEKVNVTIIQTPINDTATSVAVTYYDALAHTTGGTIDVMRDNVTPGGSRVLLQSFPVVSSSFTNTTEISHPSGMSGVVNVNATHTDFGNVKRTYTFSYKGFTVQFLGLSPDVVLMIALGLIFLTAMSGGILVGRPIAIVACFEMWVFYAWGWFAPMMLRGMATDLSLVLAMTIATVVAIGANMEIRKKKEKY